MFMDNPLVTHRVQPASCVANLRKKFSSDWIAVLYLHSTCFWFGICTPQTKSDKTGAKGEIVT